MTHTITRVAVIGAGTMGAAIAGLVASAGLPVTLLDAPPQELAPEEQARGLTLDAPAVRNRLVQAGFERMRKARPANLLRERDAELITLGNTADDLGKLADADWIVEAIVEQLEPKQQLMARVEGVAKPTAIISSNTSGIPIHRIAEGRSAEFRARFMGTHFFNPPRYLKLLEVIPTGDTSPDAVAAVRAFAERALGKGVVICKDTPNFIANRLGTFSALSDLRFILDNGYSVEEVDALTGPLIGRPSTATFRLLDLAGNDIMAYVARNLYPTVPEDESRELFKDTALLERMVAEKKLGNKAGQGFYKEQRGKGGKREFWPLDLQTFEYKPPVGTKQITPEALAALPALASPSLAEAQKVRGLTDRMRLLVRRAAEAPDDRAAQLVAHVTLPVLAYAARRLPEIADSVADVDNAMMWGYNQQIGPFALWDALGVPETAEQMRARGIAVAAWVEQMIASGAISFYKEQDGRRVAFSPVSGQYEPLAADERAISLQKLKEGGKLVVGNRSASLVDIGEGVLCLEFHSKGNTFDADILALGAQALELMAQPQWAGMVVGNEGEHFSLGANLNVMGQAAMTGQWGQLEAQVKAFQDFAQSLRHSPKPIVAAPAGRALGGGAEVIMACARTVAAAESYIGLVEFGVGLIPAGGGCKELLRRVVAPVASNAPAAQDALERVFRMISTAQVSTSAAEARDMGFLGHEDQIVFNRAHVLWEARRAVIELADGGYHPPAQARPCYALGRDGLAALKIGIYLMQTAGYATDYDAEIARRLALVLTGDGVSAPQWLDEQFILDLERREFVALCQQPKTLERARYTLETGKPLRN